jgi:hypothetical protein
MVCTESDGWEEDVARTEGEAAVLAYLSSSFDRQLMIDAIKSVGKRELMREARIAMRTIDAVYAVENVADDDLKRMADAAERILSFRRKREDERGEAIAWRKLKRDEIGLTVLAKMLDTDAANLTKVIEGKRKPSRALLAKISAMRSLRE